MRRDGAEVEGNVTGLGNGSSAQEAFAGGGGIDVDLGADLARWRARSKTIMLS